MVNSSGPVLLFTSVKPPALAENTSTISSNVTFSKPESRSKSNLLISGPVVSPVNTSTFSPGGSRALISTEDTSCTADDAMER